MKCEVCKNRKLFKFLDLGMQPLCDDLINEKSKRICKKYPTNIFFCTNCYTALHKVKIKPSTLFPKNYHYRPRFTKDVITGMKNLVNSVINFKKKKNACVLDIGCTDGSLLNIFYRKNYKTYGIEPTNSLDEASKKHKLLKKFFNKQTAKYFIKRFKAPDIITFTNVFAHINNLPELIESLKLISNQNTLIVIENHYLQSIIRKKQFDSFYHEHPRTYSLKSFTFIAKNLGFKILKVQFPKRYGGNIRVFIGKGQKHCKIVKQKILKEREDIKLLKKLQKNVKKWKKNKRKIILKLNTKFGALKAKAFPGRASILINLLNLNTQNICSVHEQSGSPKIGYRVPGTSIPISSDRELKLEPEYKPIINLAWHISKEIRHYLKKNNINNKVIDVITKSDFK